MEQTGPLLVSPVLHACVCELRKGDVVLCMLSTCPSCIFLMVYMGVVRHVGSTCRSHVLSLYKINQ